MVAKVRYEEMLPDEISEALRKAPVAYVPLGSLEFHGYHMAVGNDAIKAHEICRRAAELSGGVVLPPFYCGTAGGHTNYPTSIIYLEQDVEPIIAHMLDRLAQLGYRVIVLITGHYPLEQVAMVKKLAEAHMKRPGAAKVIAMPEHEAYPAERRGDHAAKWETSILLALRPELVDMEKLEDGRSDPLHGIFGEDPRKSASRELGQETVNVIVRNLAEKVRQALAKA